MLISIKIQRTKSKTGQAGVCWPIGAGPTWPILIWGRLDQYLAHDRSSGASEGRVCTFLSFSFLLVDSSSFSSLDSSGFYVSFMASSIFCLLDISSFIFFLFFDNLCTTFCSCFLMIFFLFLLSISVFLDSSLLFSIFYVLFSYGFFLSC